MRDFIPVADEHAEGGGFNPQPDLSDPGQALARRVQEAFERTFDGEPRVVRGRARVGHGRRGLRAREDAPPLVPSTLTIVERAVLVLLYRNSSR